MPPENAAFPSVSDDYYIAIGKVAMQWAVFQAIVDESIAVLAKVDTESGLCLTAQIISMPGKISTLLSLLHKRKCPGDLFRKMTKLMSVAQRYSTARNAIIHGVLRVNLQDRVVLRQNVSARSKFVVIRQEVDPKPLQELVPKIEKLTNDFLQLFSVLRHRLVP